MFKKIKIAGLLILVLNVSNANIQNYFCLNFVIQSCVYSGWVSVHTYHVEYHYHVTQRMRKSLIQFVPVRARYTYRYYARSNTNYFLSASQLLHTRQFHWQYQFGAQLKRLWYHFDLDRGSVNILQGSKSFSGVAKPTWNSQKVTLSPVKKLWYY